MSGTAALTGCWSPTCLRKRAPTVAAVLGLYQQPAPGEPACDCCSRGQKEAHTADHLRNFPYFSGRHENYAAANIAAACEVNQLGCNAVALDSRSTIPAGQIVNSREGVRKSKTRRLVGLRTISRFV